MRAAQAIEATKDLLRQRLAAGKTDVAEAIIGDTEMFEIAARDLGQMSATPGDLDRLITAIAADIDDGLADWLTGTADSPGAWFYTRTQ
jgi:hypothetical protein